MCKLQRRKILLSHPSTNSSKPWKVLVTYNSLAWENSARGESYRSTLFNTCFDNKSRTTTDGSEREKSFRFIQRIIESESFRYLDISNRLIMKSYVIQGKRKPNFRYFFFNKGFEKRIFEIFSFSFFGRLAKNIIQIGTNLPLFLFV